jgi:hypothetical protein
MRRLSIHRRNGYLGTLCGAAWMVAAGLAQPGAGARKSPDARAILLDGRFPVQGVAYERDRS